MIICSDLDGTLLVNKNINTQVINEIKEFREKENLFVIVTGRGKGIFETVVNEYKINFYDYVILSNGGCICDSHLRIIEYKSFSKNDIIEILGCLSIYKDKFRKYVVNFKNESISIKGQDKINHINNDVISIALQFYDKTITKKIFEELRVLIGAKHGLFINRDCIDILPKNVSKDNAILYLLDLLKLSENELYVIGDGKNDISMLEKFNNSFRFLVVIKMY